jgi:hypothetical protein
MNKSHNILCHGRTCNYFAGNYIYEKRAARTNYLSGEGIIQYLEERFRQENISIWQIL